MKEKDNDEMNRGEEKTDSLIDTYRLQLVRSLQTSVAGCVRDVYVRLFLVMFGLCSDLDL